MGLRFGKDASASTSSSKAVGWISSRVRARDLGPNLDPIAVKTGIMLTAFQVVHLDMAGTRMALGNIEREL